MKIHHILVPVDFSEGTRQALEYSAGLGRMFSSRITLLHVMEPLTPPPDGLVLSFEAYDHSLAEAARKSLGAMAAELDPEANIEMTSGNPWACIVERAQQGGIDLIVMPTHGRTALKHLLMGSVAERVVQHAPCPVLVVRQHPSSSAD